MTRGSTLLVALVMIVDGVSVTHVGTIKDMFQIPVINDNKTYSVSSGLASKDMNDGIPNIYDRGVPDEQRLMKYLFTGYEKTVRPVRNASTPVVIRMGLTLTQIFDMDEKDQVLVTNVWLDQEWEDEFMRWQPEDFANITMLRIPCYKLWLPDIVLYNNAAEYTDGLMPANAMVSFTGNVFWPVPTKLQSSCKVDVTYFPFDTQTCRMKFGSWTYDGFQVDITNRTSEVDLSNYVNNGEWELISIKIVRNVVVYACCNEPFPDVTFTVEIRRRILYYMYNVIFPCIMMSALTLLVFCLPPDSGEKIALGITVLLAFSVFMLAVAENLPETSEFVPLISIYLTIVMALTSMSVIMTVFVLNLHHRGPSRRPVPFWLKHVLLDKMAPYLCLHDNTSERYFPSEDRLLKNVSMRLTLDNIQQALQNDVKVDTSGHVTIVQQPATSPMADQQTQGNHVTLTSNNTCSTRVQNESVESEPSPPSHVYPNVEIFRQIETTTDNHANIVTTTTSPVEVQSSRVSGRQSCPVETSVDLTASHQQQREAGRIPRSKSQQYEAHPNKTNQTSLHGSASKRHNVVYHPLKTGFVASRQSSSNNDSYRRQKRKSNSSLSKTNEEILTSLKRILEKHEKEDRDYEVVQEWRKVAQSVDRILFFIFLLATLSSTIGVLVIAPVLQ